MKVLKNGMFVDRVVLLTLRRREDRAEAFLKQYQELKRSGRWVFPEVEVIYGVDGGKTGSPRGRSGTDGGWGCRQTHLRALEDALTDDVERLLVFEDDAQLTELLETNEGLMSKFLRQIPDDWGMIYLGYYHHEGLFEHVDGTSEVFEAQDATVYNLQAYMLNRPAMSKLYRDLNSPGYADTFAHEGEDAIDLRIDQIAKNGGLRRYLPRKCLCNQDGELGSDNPWATLE
jgi:GR25 family glycosyltransferase involved in LPS biosynthesis